MADVAVLFHHGILAGEAVHDAVILNIGSVFYYNTTEVAAQAGIRPNIDPFSQDHVANEYRRRMNIALIRHHWRQPINLINRHATSLDARQTAKALKIKRTRGGKLAN